MEDGDRTAIHEVMEQQVCAFTIHNSAMIKRKRPVMIYLLMCGVNIYENLTICMNMYTVTDYFHRQSGYQHHTQCTHCYFSGGESRLWPLQSKTVCAMLLLIVYMVNVFGMNAHIDVVIL